MQLNVICYIIRQRIQHNKAWQENKYKKARGRKKKEAKSSQLEFNEPSNFVTPTEHRTNTNIQSIHTYMYNYFIKYSLHLLI